MLVQSLPWLLLAALLPCCVCAAAWPIFGRKRSTLFDPSEDDLDALQPEEQQEQEQAAALPASVDEQALDQLMQQVVNLNDRLAGFDAKRLVLVETNAQLTIQLKGRTTELYHARAELGARKEELSRAVARQHELETLHLHQQQRLEQDEEALRDLETRLTSQTLELETTSRRLSEVERDLSEQLVDLDARAASCQDELAEKVREVAEMARQLLSAEQRCQELEALARDTAQVESERGELDQESLQRAEREREQALGRIGELDGELARRDEQSRARAAAIETLENRLGDQTHRSDVLSRRCEGLELELRQRTSDLEATEERALAREHELSGRLAEIEGQHARRDEELHGRIAEIEAQAAQRELEHHGRIAEIEGQGARREHELHERNTETERQGARREHDLHERIVELEGQAARRDEELGLHLATLETLRSELVESRNRGDEGARREHEFHERIVELERQAARRDEELRLHLATLEALHGELAESQNRGDESARSCAELEHSLRLQTQSQRENEESARDRELELRARIGGLEQQAAELGDELQKRSATLEAVLGALTDKTARCEELVQHAAELEARLTALESENQELRGERAELAESQESLSRRLAAREREVERHEHDLGQAGARIDVLSLEVERHADELGAELAPIAEFVEGRITALFDPRAAQTPEQLVQSYEHGLAERDLELAVRGLLGGTEPLSAEAMARLGARWQSEHEAWRTEPIEGEVVYLWADGPKVRAGLEAEDSSLLVIVAGLVDGSRRVLTVESGPRESADAWLAALQGLLQRGMRIPRLVIAEDGLGIWPAVATLGWDCAQQRSWERRIDHVTDALPKRQKRRAAELLRRISKAEKRAAAIKLRDSFVKRYRARRPDAVERLQTDWNEMIGIYGFPKDHWAHLRNAAVIGSLLDSMRLSTNLSKPAAHTPYVEAILWKFLLAGAKSLRKLNSPHLLPAVATSEVCVDGILKQPPKRKSRTKTRAAKKPGKQARAAKKPSKKARAAKKKPRSKPRAAKKSKRR